MLRAAQADARRTAKAREAVENAGCAKAMPPGGRAGPASTRVLLDGSLVFRDPVPGLMRKIKTEQESGAAARRHPAAAAPAASGRQAEILPRS